MPQQKSASETIYSVLRKGPLLVGEVRGFKSEIGKKFDKSDKNAPPIIFGVSVRDRSAVSMSGHADKTFWLSIGDR